MLTYFQDKNATFWLRLMPSLVSISQAVETSTVSPETVSGDSTDVYSTMTWLLLATVLLLLVLLAVSWVIARY